MGSVIMANTYNLVVIEDHPIVKCFTKWVEETYCHETGEVPPSNHHKDTHFYP